jgi:DNA-binding LytR/AlgR family response regulator
MGCEMKVIIDVDENLTEECIVIKCQSLDERIVKLQNVLSAQINNTMDLLLYKDGKEYYIPADQLLFFETENKQVFAHTKSDMYETDYKLYELEDVLSKDFMRVSKSAIININYILSISKNITASSIVEFKDSHKKVYVSRGYYKALIERLDERRKVRRGR